MRRPRTRQIEVVNRLTNNSVAAGHNVALLIQDVDPVREPSQHYLAHQPPKRRPHGEHRHKHPSRHGQRDGDGREEKLQSQPANGNLRQPTERPRPPDSHYKGRDQKQTDSTVLVRNRQHGMCCHPNTSIIQ
jgi:hypothetical protein